MNEQLRFSWGHIIAFLALIFIAYVTFMGITYYTLGNFVIAGIGAAICVFLLAISILGAQIKKGSSDNYYKSIIRERCLLLMSPLILLLVFIPYNHFWTVLDKEEVIVNDFNSSIQNARGIFADYEAYSNNRIDLLSHNLSKYTAEQKNNRINELKLLLLSDNYNKLKIDANLWIDNASANSSVWNVFLLGNVDNIIKAVNYWSQDLNHVSQKHLSSENYDVSDFSADNLAKQKTIIGLQNLKNSYSNSDFKFNLLSFITIVFCYIMLLIPYFIQERNAANCEKFCDFWIFSSLFDSKVKDISEVKNDGTQDMPIDEIKKINEQETTTINMGKGAPV